jgi:hypothetical protein
MPDKWERFVSLQYYVASRIQYFNRFCFLFRIMPDKWERFVSLQYYVASRIQYFNRFCFLFRIMPDKWERFVSLQYYVASRIQYFNRFCFLFRIMPDKWERFVSLQYYVVSRVYSTSIDFAEVILVDKTITTCDPGSKMFRIRLKDVLFTYSLSPKTLLSMQYATRKKSGALIHSSYIQYHNTEMSSVEV